MHAFLHWMNRLSVACAVAAAVMFAVAACVITWSVIYRTLGASTYWEIEFAVYMMVASIFLASPYTLATDGHVGVDLISQLLPPRVARVLAGVVAAVGLVVCIYLAVAGGLLTVESLAKGERTESAWAPYKWPLYLTMPIGLGLTALQYIAQWIGPARKDVA